MWLYSWSPKAMRSVRCRCQKWKTTTKLELDLIISWRIFYKGAAFITGGIDSEIGSREVDRVSLTDGTVTRAPDLNEERTANASVATAKGVFVVGGYNRKDKRLSSCELLPPSQDR